jgi:hypothetical protein
MHHPSTCSSEATRCLYSLKSNCTPASAGDSSTQPLAVYTSTAGMWQSSTQLLQLTQHPPCCSLTLTPPLNPLSHTIPLPSCNTDSEPASQQ